jgi:hypothetical protein
MYGASRDAYDYLMGANPPSGGGQNPPYDPMRDIRIDDGANLNPNTPKTGTGKYVFDPVTKQYKWVPDPIKPVDVAAPIFENPTQRGGGGGGGNRGTDGFDGGPTSTNTSGDSNAEGNGFAPTSQGAYNVSRLGQAVSTFSPLIGAPISAYGNYLARNVDPNYSHEGLNAGPAPTQSTNDGTAGEQAAQQALADGTAATALQASYDRTTSASSPTATGGEIQNPKTIEGITAAEAMQRAAETKESEAANIRSMLAAQVDSGDAMQRAVDSQALSQQPGLAGLSMQQAIDKQNAAISASSPTATGGIASLAPAFGTTTPTNDGDAGEGAAQSAQAQSQAQAASDSRQSANDGNAGQAAAQAAAQSSRDAATSASSPTATSGGPSASSSTGNAPMGANAAPPGGPPSGGGQGGGGGRVICTHFYSKGEMSREMWRADLDFAFKNFSPSTIRGYQYWAIPYVKLMRKSKLAEDIMRPLAMHRAKEIYYQMGKSPKGSLFGKLIRLAGEPVCFVLGLFVGEQNWQSLWKPAKD